MRTAIHLARAAMPLTAALLLGLQPARRPQRRRKLRSKERELLPA
jgi:hypothetical protein